MKKWIIKKLGGWTDDDVLTEAVKELFNTINEDDILREVSKQWMIGDRPLTDVEKKLIISEAQIFLKSKLWKILKRDIQYNANKAMFEKAKTENDLTAGKLWLYTLDCFETRLNQLVK